MNIQNIINSKNKYKTAYKNYLSVMWNVWRGKDKIKVVLCDGKIKYFNSFHYYMYPDLTSNKKIQIYDFRPEDNYMEFTYNGKDVNLAFRLGSDIGAVFGKEDYSFLNIDNETVVDIGANIGDSPIYFTLNNAKRVISLEPYPYSYNLALKNIETNNYQDRIILLNAGYGEDSILKVNPNFENTTGSDLKSFDEGINIKVFSLKTLLNKFNIDKAVLKMDCEGCEYNLLKEDNNTLRKFSRIQIEYHYGYYKLLRKLEEAGFTVTYTEPKTTYNKVAVNPNMSIGFIYGKLNV